MRRLLALLVLALPVPAAEAIPPPPQRHTSTEVTIAMSDGVSIAATLLLPDGEGAPWPAIVMLHGIGGSRTDLLPIAQRFALARYAVLAFDARGHGQSGGLTSIDGPREIQDVRELVDWLRNRAEINGQQVGAWGISLGGGAVLRAVGEGVPFAAAEVVQTWTDLYRALAPGNLPKSGAIAGFLSSISGRAAPEVAALGQSALSGRNLESLRAFAAVRSSLGLLRSVRTPVYLFQGRRDFAFDLREATSALAALRGPKKLWLGDFGHSPSSFPGRDIESVLNEGIRWFEAHLSRRGRWVSAPVAIAPDPWRGHQRELARLPPTQRLSFKLPGTQTIAPSGRVTRSTFVLPRRLETFGSPVVQVNARLRRGWERVVAVLTAKPPRGAELVVSEGGINTRGLSGRRRLAIRLIDQATPIPPRSRLQLTLAASSTTQDPSNLLYLDSPMPSTARLTVGPVRLVVPVLRNVISR